MSSKWVYLFSEGNKDMRDLLGGKGANLAEMNNAGLPVPPGFTITTEACNAYFANDKQFPEGMWNQVLEALKTLEKQTGKRLGDPANPLLVSARSGARISMPGMMDTVLNIGFNQKVLDGFAKLTGNIRVAWDAYRRLIQMFGNIVKEISRHKFEAILDEYKAKTEGGRDTDLSVAMLKDIVRDFKDLYQSELGEKFPDDPLEQIRQAIAAVFNSWFGAPATSYRNAEGISHDWGTAVNIQTMVFGNMGERSGTGVAFTRNPASGEKQVWGEYLLNAQGEDVVAGIRTPQPISHLEEDLPKIWDEFINISNRLEQHYRDMQDLEFTIERDKLYMLQTRTGKRTAIAAVKIAVDMVQEGLIEKNEAILRVNPNQIDQFLHPRFDPEAVEEAKNSGHLIAWGLNASPGAATGLAIFDADTAAERGQAGEKVILVRPETNPDDVHGMIEAQGILTQRGGMTSHAAVVARGWGKACVAGCETISIDMDARTFRVGDIVIREGDPISIDGTTGSVFQGEIRTIDASFDEESELVTLLSWADEIRKLGVWTNADNPKDARRARSFGAEGIGLCRTEHMFFEEERRPIVVKMIMSEDESERQKLLDQLLPFQREDFEGIFRAMDGFPVIVRLIDPPMHEFLPTKDELNDEICQLQLKLQSNPSETMLKRIKKKIAEKEHLLDVVESMWETNPMMGLRGCRAGISYPGLTEMQVRAIFEAACNVAKEGVKVYPEVMIPLVSHVNELMLEREKLEKVVKDVLEEKDCKLKYKFGLMIETPRAALTADVVAQYADFFSFGTNDLTQMTYGVSRDDAEGKFLRQYVAWGILPNNPFEILDRDGVGTLMKITIEKGLATNPKLEIGGCGEHFGEPSSIEFSHIIGLNYVSASPFRVPIARLAAAQAALNHKYGRNQVN
ncbi:MAG: pyruvate, phosphate dikinase [Candidatus Odinarchaeota archaeon]